MYNIKHKILVLPGINGRFLHTGTNVPDWTGTFVPATQMCVKVLTNYFFYIFLKLSQYRDTILTIPVKKYNKIFFFISTVLQNSYLNFSYFHKIICFCMSWVGWKGKSIITSCKWVHLTPWDKISPSYLIYSSKEK